MPEELKPDGLGFAASRDPATLAAWAEARDLNEKDVFDIHGRKLGRVTRCFAEEGALTRCDVTLTPNAKQLFQAERDVAGIPATWIARVDESGVKLRKAGEEVLQPPEAGLPRDGHAEGAPELPRKER